jgi:hypothetical protein
MMEIQIVQHRLRLRLQPEKRVGGERRFVGRKREQLSPH